MYKQPKFGQQSVQEYHPERGYNFYYQVSTYNGESWTISFCSPVDLAETKRIDKEKVYVK